MLPYKKIKLDKEFNECDLFYSWCASNKISINNAVILRSLNCSGNGLFADKDFETGEVIFTIPKSILLTQSSSDISIIVQKECNNVSNKWIPLLINIIYEYCLKEKSKWFPYFNLTLNFDELDLPLFWSRNEIEELLSCIGIVSSVINDLNGIEKDFNEIVRPFIDKYKDKFRSMNIDLHFYKKIVSFVMAYSFTLPEDESECPILVPLADILNHVTNNNAKLVFGLDSLSMVAVKNIKKEDEIFNTFGELSNSSLLHMYGFAEDLINGNYDYVEIPLSTLFKESVAKDLTEKNKSSQEINLFAQDDVFLLQHRGIADKNFVKNFLRTYLKHSSNSLNLNDDSKSEQSDFDSEEFNSDYNDDEDDILTFDEISKLDFEFKEILLRLVAESIKKYPNSISQEQLIISSYKNQKLNSQSNEVKIETESLNENEANKMEAFDSNQQVKRKFYTACVRKGHLILLNKLKSVLK